MAMVLTGRRLRTHRPPIDGYLLLQIHDELVWEIRHEHVDTAAGSYITSHNHCFTVASPTALLMVFCQLRALSCYDDHDFSCNIVWLLLLQL